MSLRLLLNVVLTQLLHLRLHWLGLFLFDLITSKVLFLRGLCVDGLLVHFGTPLGDRFFIKVRMVELFKVRWVLAVTGFPVFADWPVI